MAAGYAEAADMERRTPAEAMISAWESLAREVHVWYCRPDYGERWEGVLSADEREGMSRYRLERVRLQYVATRALCRTTLSRYAAVDPKDWRFERTEHGKPWIAGPADFGGLRFNLSHADGLIACAVTRVAEVGVDAEDITRRVDEGPLAERFFSPEEAAVIAGLVGAERRRKFFEYWVVKEAYLKAIGEGIAYGLNLYPEPGEDWKVETFEPDGRHLLAAALRTPQRPEFRWREVLD